MGSPTFADRVKETTTTTGTGTVNLAGAVGAYQTFVAGIGSGNDCYYCIAHQSLGEWEVGVGTVTSGSPNVLSRTRVLASSNSGALVSFSSGTKDVFQTAPAAFVTAQMSIERNRIINGDMRIDQRNAGALMTSIANSAFSVDRWQYSASVASKFNARQNLDAVTPPSGFSKYLGLKVSAGYTVTTNDFFQIRHVIEGQNAADFAWGTAAAQTVTLSFWVYSNLTGNHCLSVANYDGSRQYPVLYNIAAASTWQKISITIPGDTSGTWLTDNGAGIFLRYMLGCGSGLTTTNATWTSSGMASTGLVQVVATTNNTFFFTGVQLEKGAVATDFERRSIGAELTLCERYFEKSNDLSSVPGYAPGAGNNVIKYGHPTALSLNSILFRTRKRATPTLTIYDGAGTAGKVCYFTGSWANNGAIAYQTANETSLFVDATLASAFATNFDFSASAEF